MISRLLNNRQGLVVVVLLLILAVSIVLQGPEPPPEPAYLPDGRSSRGLLILNRWLGTMGYEVETMPSDGFALSPETGLLFVYPVEEAFTEAEAAVLDEWVTNGGTLVVVGDGSAELRRRFDFDPSEAIFSLGVSEIRQPLPLIPSAPDPLDTWLVSNQIQSDSPEMVVVLVDENGDGLAGVRAWGEGQFWLLSTDAALTNRQLTEDEQGHLLLALLRGVPDGATVLFDTYHLFGPEPLADTEIRTIQDWLYGTATGRGTLLLLVLVGGYLLLQGGRLGPPVVPIEQVRRREAAEFVTAMAGLQRRARITDSIARHHRQRLLQTLGRRYHLSHDLTDAEFIHRLRAPDLHLHSGTVTRIERVLAELARLPNEDRLVELVAEVDALVGGKRGIG